MEFPIKINSLENYHFGVLEVNTESGPISNLVWDILFSVDTSASMTDKCSDYHTKIYHIKHTLKNILRLFSENKNAKFNVCLQTFDNTYEEMFDFIEITSENVDKYNCIIDKITPDGSTNLKIPLDKSKEKYKKRNKLHANNNFVHIILTDGEDTCKNSFESLVNSVSNEFKNIFIGFGIDHNSKLLEEFAKNYKNEYKFIDKVESAGIVYGEIIHNILYAKYINVCIKINNGAIYDWKKNSWVDELYIDSLCKGLNKTFHIKSKNPKNVYGTITGSILEDNTSKDMYTLDNITILDNIIKMPDLINEEDNSIDNINHTKYLYRQKVLELLYKTKKINFYKDEIEMKRKLRAFYYDIKKYMTNNRLENDIFWKVMLDDIYISYKTVGTKYSHMYTNSRQMSQGRECSWNVGGINYIPEMNTNNRRKFMFPEINSQMDDGYEELSSSLSNIPLMPPSPKILPTIKYDYLKNNPNNLSFDDDTQNPFEEFDDFDDIEHEISMPTDSPYITQEILNTMSYTSNY